MLSHEDYYNMKYILKDKKTTLKYISGTWVHWFFAINEHREKIENILLIYHAEWCMMVIDERRCKNEQSERD